jgi:hypothetical protein
MLLRQEESRRRRTALQSGKTIQNPEYDWLMIEAMLARYMHTPWTIMLDMPLTKIFDQLEWAAYYLHMEAYYVQIGIIGGQNVRS